MSDPIRGIYQLFWWCAAILLLAGCATTVPPNITVKRTGTCSCAKPDYASLHLRYFGTGGFLFEYGANAILTAPFFSNFSLGSAILPLPISPKSNVIDRLLPELSNVEAILVGHSHYDHLIDLPYILNSGKTLAPVYGDKNTFNLLSSNVSNKVFNVETNAGNYESSPAAGKWFTNANQRIRFMPFKSMHAPHLFGLVFMNGEIKEPLDTLPATAWGWKGCSRGKAGRPPAGSRGISSA